MPLPAESLRRRPSLIGAALIALALWVQALAPVGALRMMLGSPTDPALSIVCGHGPDRAEASASVDHQDAAAPACALCQLCRAGLTPPPVPNGPTLARRLRWRVVAWPIRSPVRIQLQSRPSAHPRAPPANA